jgi:uncharacterized membrane protein
VILSVIGWWVAASFLGLAAFPIAFRLFGRLPDRGYGVSRMLGILAAGYVLWLGATTGFLLNTPGGALGSLIAVAGIGLTQLARNWREMRDWLRGNLRILAAVEVIYLVSFVVWAFVRANNPEIVATEKPMELAFLNSILRSERFPPPDPWLSGYAISYYYFGYVLLALLAHLTGVTAGVAFNLGNATWFALSIVGSYSVLFNLLTLRDGKSRRGAALLGPLFVILAGNLEGFLEVIHSLHFAWRSGQLTSGFWTWLGIKDLVSPPAAGPLFLPQRYLWWWRASRVVHDVNLASMDVEVIDEFPFFSFLLADNHPHLLTLPFALMAVSFALQVYLHVGENAEKSTSRSWPSIPRQWIAWAGGAALAVAAIRGIGIALALGQGVEGLRVFLGTVALTLGAMALVAVLGSVLLGRVPSILTAQEFLFSAWLFGALAFLNTWDFPIYLSLLVGAAWWRARAAGWRTVLPQVIVTGLALAAGGVLAYLPWYPTFKSQAGGILPNLIYPTRLIQLLVMFGTALAPLLAWLIWKLRSAPTEGRYRQTLLLGLGLPAGLLAVSWALAGLIYVSLSQEPPALGQVMTGLGFQSTDSIPAVILSRRGAHPWSALALGLIAAASMVLLHSEGSPRRPGRRVPQDPGPWPFVLLLIGLGAVLVLAPEFVYLKDSFGNRMNTVFKFYFSCWIVWGLAAGYAVTDLLTRGRREIRWLGGSLLLLPLFLGLFYTVLATWTKTNGFRPQGGITLDGTQHLAQSHPQDYRAILWMQAYLPDGIVAEAVGGSYTEYGRISAHTGLPTVMGWEFHEYQWRGSYDFHGTRSQDIQTLFQTRDWTQAKAIVDQYGIDYVYVGPLERSEYGSVSDRKFEYFMDKIYDQDEVLIFARRAGGG